MHHATDGMSLDDLAIFLAVARHASFALASRATAIPPSSVSRAVARLEAALGLTLLRRTSRRVALTDDGRRLLAEAGPHLDGASEAIAAMGDRAEEPSGVVRVTAPAFTGATRVAAALADFARAHPRIRVELDASNVLRDLVEDGYDFGIRIGTGPSGRPAVDADFVARRLWTGHFALVASRAFVRAELGGKPVVTRARLASGPCIATPSRGSWRFRTVRGRVHEVDPGVRFAVNDPRGAVEVARRGLGIALVPLDAATAVPELQLLATPLGELEPAALFLVYPSRRWLPRHVRLAIDWLVATADPALTAVGGGGSGRAPSTDRRGARAG